MSGQPTVVQLTINLDNMMVPDPLALLDKLTEDQRFEIAKQIVDKCVFGNAYLTYVDSKVQERFGDENSNNRWDRQRYRDELRKQHSDVRDKLFEECRNVVLSGYLKILESQKDQLSEDARKMFNERAPELFLATFDTFAKALISNAYLGNSLMGGIAVMHDQQNRMLQELRNRGFPL